MPSPSRLHLRALHQPSPPLPLPALLALGRPLMITGVTEDYRLVSSVWCVPVLNISPSSFILHPSLPVLFLLLFTFISTYVFVPLASLRLSFQFSFHPHRHNPSPSPPPSRHMTVWCASRSRTVMCLEVRGRVASSVILDSHVSRRLNQA